MGRNSHTGAKSWVALVRNWQLVIMSWTWEIVLKTKGKWTSKINAKRQLLSSHTATCGVFQMTRSAVGPLLQSLQTPTANGTQDALLKVTLGIWWILSSLETSWVKTKLLPKLKEATFFKIHIICYLNAIFVNTKIQFKMRFVTKIQFKMRFVCLLVEDRGSQFLFR